MRQEGTRVRVPGSLEDNHFLFMGDSGSGKSSLIRQLLTQIAERGETAIVYDPALEYTGQFYCPERGDVVLNPLDRRMPYWSPSDEVIRPSEALTLAASLFPETDRENPFFVQGPRKIFAHLLNLKPTPEELLGWLSDEHELERRLKGTPLAAMIYENAGPQRGGMFGALSMVADSLKLLPPPVKVESVQKKLDGGRMVRPSARLGLRYQYSRSQGATASTHQHVARHDDTAIDEPGPMRPAPCVVRPG